MFNYDTYFEESVDEIFNSRDNVEFVEDTLIDQLVGYNLVEIANNKELRDEVFETIVERTKQIIGEHFKDDIDAEYEESEREYRADLAYDMYKEGC
jgi:thioredoxin reductase